MIVGFLSEECLDCTSTVLCYSFLSSPFLFSFFVFFFLSPFSRLRLQCFFFSFSFFPFHSPSRNETVIITVPSDDWMDSWWQRSNRSILCGGLIDCIKGGEASGTVE